MAQLLLFNIGAEKRRKLFVLSLRLGLVCRDVPPEDFGKTLAALTGRAEAEPEPGAEPFAGEMLVLDGLREEQLNALLTGLRRERATVALKAVVTEHNLLWTPAELYRELAAEHEALRGGAGSVHGGGPRKG